MLRTQRKPAKQNFIIVAKRKIECPFDGKEWNLETSKQCTGNGKVFYFPWQTEFIGEGLVTGKFTAKELETSFNISKSLCCKYKGKYLNKCTTQTFAGRPAYVPLISEDGIADKVIGICKNKTYQTRPDAFKSEMLMLIN